MGFALFILHRKLQIEELHNSESKLPQGKISLHGLCKLTETEVKLERNLQVNKTRSLELDLGNLGLEMPQVSLESYDRKYHCFLIKKMEKAYKQI